MFRATHRSSSGVQKLYLQPPVLRTPVVARRQPQAYVKPEAADTVFELLMMNDMSLKTC
jgi:hypothetical protein